MMRANRLTLLLAVFAVLAVAGRAYSKAGLIKVMRCRRCW